MGVQIQGTTDLTRSIGIAQLKPESLIWAGDWNESTATLTGSGASAVNDGGVAVSSGATDSSTARRSLNVAFDMNSAGGDTTAPAQVNFARDFYIAFSVCINTAQSATAGNSWIKFGNSDTSADPVGASIGIVVEELTLKGFTHDAVTYTETAALQTMTADTIYVIVIQKIAGVVTWYIDGTSAGSTTTTVPTTQVAGFFTVATANGINTPDATQAIKCNNPVVIAN